MRNKKVLNVIIGIIVILLIGGAIYLETTVYPKLKLGKEISDLLRPILSEENQSLHLDVIADVAGEALVLDSDIYVVKEEELQYLILEQMDFPIYIVDSLLLFENGNAFKLSEEAEETKHTYDELFVQIAAVYEAFDITCVKTDLESLYSINIAEGQVVKLVAQNGILDRIEIAGRVEQDGKSVQVDAVISEFQTLEAGAYEIPEIVQHTVKTVDRDTLFSLTEDLYRLLAAFERFQKEETKDGVVTLHANCGIINFTNTFDLDSFQENETTSVNATEIENLPEMMALLCMEAEIRCMESQGEYDYTFSLDEEAMQKIAGMVVPEMVNYVMQFTEGAAEVIVVNNQITDIEISIEGNVNMLITKVPMEISVKFQYE